MAEATFSSFMKEVKQLEQKDSIYTSEKQISRLLRPGSSYANLNPFEVLLIEPEATLDEIKKQYKKLSILLHPDKNPDDKVRAQSAFDVITKAYKGLEDETTRTRALEVVEEANFKVKQTMDEKRKKLRKEGKKDARIEEDDPERQKQAVKVMTMKLFADYERKRRSNEERAMEERKRKREGEIEEEEKKKVEQEWNKNYEESRETRVGNWQNFQKNKKSKNSKGVFRPPKQKPEARE